MVAGVNKGGIYTHCFSCISSVVWRVG
jgi:hypothetical protein